MAGENSNNIVPPIALMAPAIANNAVPQSSGSIKDPYQDHILIEQCELLGEGTFGRVTKAYSKTNPDLTVAIKQVFKLKLCQEELEMIR